MGALRVKKPYHAEIKINREKKPYPYRKPNGTVSIFPYQERFKAYRYGFCGFPLRTPFREVARV
jgi:hypothetical protein